MDEVLLVDGVTEKVSLLLGDFGVVSGSEMWQKVLLQKLSSTTQT